MQNTEKKLHHQASGESCFSKKEIGSKINTTEKNVGERYYTKRYKPIQRSQVKTIGSILSKRRGSEFSSNGARKNSLNGKQIRRKIVQKVSDTNSSEKPLSSILQCGKFSLHGRDTNGDLGTRKVDRRRKRKRRKENRVQDDKEKAKEDTDGDLGTRKVNRRRKRKRRKENREQDEASRLQRRTRYLLIKMKLEQNLIDAYSSEGWKGQSREKIKPVRELQRAKKQILKCKLGIRDAIRQLDLLGSEGCIEQSVLGPDGSVFHEHIFCAKCKSREAFPDNDIILCDGTCNCAFHQKCLEPPLATENIPPGDQGWFCKFCECKMEILEAINAHIGTHFSANSNWQEIFEEAAMGPDGENASLNPEDEWPSDESDDDDYDPERNEMSCSFSRSGAEDNNPDEASSSSSFFWTSDEEAILQSRRLENDGSPTGGFYQGKERGHFVDLMDDINSDDTTDREMKTRRRQRRDVDYRKLHDEMFGKDVLENEQVSEDEDWGPGRRRRRLNETDAAGTLVALCGNGDGCSDVMPIKAKRSVSEDKRTLFRIPPNAVEKLRRVFAENELPSRAVKENLSKQLGIASEKINKWFKNARYTALKIRKADSTKQLPTTSMIAKESTAATGNNWTTDLMTSNGNSYAVPSDNEGVQTPISLGKIRRRRNTKSLTISPKKKQHKRTARAQPTHKNEVSTLLSNTVSFKKKLKAAPKEDKIKPKYELVTSKKTEQLYLAEMERLCHLEAKLAELKKVLLRICNDKNHVTDQINMDEPVIIYVPVAEVRVKG
ncbi:Homeobox domain [Macleaya cordata]|uniref:Homeobox domain n=1 Tax=Macleaya cordata TaxID=56857 RepID=A0A200PLW9_MACCD|nr:Homeobox domain [Macleaya cordata]